MRYKTSMGAQKSKEFVLLQFFYLGSPYVTLIKADVSQPMNKSYMV